MAVLVSVDSLGIYGYSVVGTPKENFEALKIKAGYQFTLGGQSATERREVDISYYYSPKAKAIVAFNSKSEVISRKVSLVDYQVAE